MSRGYTTEKKVLSDFLQLYKESECLWKSSHQLYGNKEARDRAYVVLLEKYRILQNDATVDNVKKKIEYLRSAYRREHKKVLAARASGDREHIPTLWYYEYLTFLNDVSEFGKFENVTFVSESDEDSNRNRLEYGEPPLKKEKLSSIFLTEEDHRSEQDILVPQDNERPEYLYMKTEAESFGRTVGMQLNELTPMQRYMAEKLISDVIFYGRMERLNTHTNLNLNEERF